MLKQSERGDAVSQFLVRFGTRGIFEGLMKRASKRKCLLATINTDSGAYSTVSLGNERVTVCRHQGPG
jgi:hypothetical protein